MRFAQLFRKTNLTDERRLLSAGMLMSLDLSHNHLDQFENGQEVFRPLDRLLNLQITHNHLRNIPQDVFQFAFA